MIGGFVRFNLQVIGLEPVETFAVRVPCVGEQIADRWYKLRTVTKVRWERDLGVRVKGEMPVVALVFAE